MREILNLSLRLAAICAVAALALARVDAATRGPIAAAEARARREAVAAVLPAFARLHADTLRDGQRVYWTGLDEQGRPVGTAFTAASPLGYSGAVDVMVGVAPAGTVSGVRILRHAETPGLGANYAAPDVLEAFYAGRAVDADWRVKKDGGDFDAVTGATVTGRAVCDAVGRGLDAWREDRPRLPAAAPHGGGGE